MLVAEYAPGTPLGWHRDVPEHEDVFGVSLGSTATLRFRPYPPVAPKRADVVKLRAAPRSIYAMRGPARWGWQHSVAPVDELRWSITMRTARERIALEAPASPGKLTGDSQPSAETADTPKKKSSRSTFFSTAWPGSTPAA